MISESYIKDLLLSMGYIKKNHIYEKFFPSVDCYIKVDLKNRTIIYPEDRGMTISNRTTCNFSAPENFVVLECVTRLFDKGYRPKHLNLEKEWTLGHESKGGRADICVSDQEGNTLFIVECKTYGREYEKEYKNIVNDGGQLFSYWQQERSCKFLVLYASKYEGKQIKWDTESIDCSDDANIVALSQKDDSIKLFKNAHTVSELYSVWDETYEKRFSGDVIFRDDSSAYQIGVKPLRKADLKDFADNNKIVNKFEEILRHNNVSDKENAFNRLVALFICKLVDEIQKDKDAIEQYKFEADRAEREGDYGKVAEIRYGKIKEAERRIEEVKAKLADMKHGNSLIREEVTEDDIAAVVSKWTGIPVNRMMQSERQKLLHLEDELHKRVVGQEMAITALADAVRRNRAGLQDAKRPIGSFIFLGTTGVGKTELAKALAEFLFDDESLMTRIDMSEYQERHSVSRLIGAPPGYVGYDEGGQLTEAVRRKPYSVVLLDEIEKAHPDVFNILLQVLDDGRLTDNKGRVVDFKNTIIIMTSNIGAHIIQERLKGIDENNRDEVLDKTNHEVYEMLKQTIRPEFLNRIDEIIMFAPLKKSEIVDIVRLQFNGVKKMLENNGIAIEITDKAVQWLAEAGYDPQFGARPVKRVIQRTLLNDLSKQILAEEVSKDSRIMVDVKDDKIVFENK